MLTNRSSAGKPKSPPSRREREKGGATARDKVVAKGRASPLLGMSFTIGARFGDLSPVASFVAVQSSQRKSVGPDPAHLLIEILAKVGYVKNASAIVQVRINQVFPQALEHR